MRRFPDYRPKGVIPATLLAFDDDLDIDEASTRKHLRDCALIDGVAACTFDEQRRILEFSLDEVGDRVAVVCGVYADGSLEAARIARMADQAGASCLLVFPPQSMTAGGQLRPEMALVHFETIAAATDLPIIVFEYPMATGLGYPFDTLLRLFDAVPSIRAIKDWCSDPMLHERHIRTFRGLSPAIAVLTTHSGWLMSSLVLGADGLLSGAGSVIADLQVALFEAVQAKDLARAQAINDRMYPLVQAFYAPPFLDMHNRMKECLRLLGRIDKAVVRPPLVKLSDAEIARLTRALSEAGVGSEGALAQAAE
jgi:4-hydroxy-tetrahydrodipicolinate synthase